jgi:hypothetical protein
MSLENSNLFAQDFSSIKFLLQNVTYTDMDFNEKWPVAFGKI